MNAPVSPAVKLCGKKLLQQLGLGGAAVILLAVLLIFGIILAEEIYGGAHVVTDGQSHGFKIGMTKEEVFRRYKELNELANIRVGATDGSPGKLILESRAANMKFTQEFESGDQWMAYRDQWPIDFQEFYFANGKLTNITTYIRFYETP